MAHIPLSLESARRWIGREVILKEDYREFKAGSHCVVSCAIDYGDQDGLLLWVDGKLGEEDRFREVDQFDYPTFKRLFRSGAAADREASPQDAPVSLRAI